MSFLSFNAYPLWINVVVYALSAAAIWWAGTRLERGQDPRFL